MTFNDLPKQQRLLIYMFYYEAESGSAITMAKNGNDILAYGISKNKNSLANMLYTLRKKGLVAEARLRNGDLAYLLTKDGADSAMHFINLYGRAAQAEEAEEAKNSLYKQVELLKAENAAKDEKISVLTNSLRDALQRLDEKTKQAQHLEDALSKIENSLGQMAAWAHSLKNGSN